MKFKVLAKSIAIAALGLIGIGGCVDRPTIFVNPDPSLRLSSSELRGDALDRFPYKEDAPKGREIKARAQVGYTFNRLEVVNFSESDWNDVEVWVNKKYVCHVPKMESRKLKEIHFPMLFDSEGKPFPMNSNKGTELVRSVEVYRDGKMYQLPVEAVDIH